MKLICAVTVVSLFLCPVQCARLSDEAANRENETQSDIAWRQISQSIWGRHISCCHLPFHLQTCDCCQAACMQPQKIHPPLPNCCNLPRVLQKCDCCPSSCVVVINPPQPALQNCCHLRKPFLNCQCCPAACKPRPLRNCCDLPAPFRSCKCCRKACRAPPPLLPPPPSPPLQPNCCHLPQPLCRCCPSACYLLPEEAPFNERCCHWPKFLQSCDCCASGCPVTPTESAPEDDCCNLAPNLQNCSCCPSTCTTTVTIDSDIDYEEVTKAPIEVKSTETTETTTAGETTKITKPIETTMETTTAKTTETTTSEPTETTKTARITKRTEATKAETTDTTKATEMTKTTKPIETTKVVETTETTKAIETTETTETTTVPTTSTKVTKPTKATKVTSASSTKTSKPTKTRKPTRTTETTLVTNTTEPTRLTKKPTRTSTTKKRKPPTRKICKKMSTAVKTTKIASIATSTTTTSVNCCNKPRKLQRCSCCPSACTTQKTDKKTTVTITTIDEATSIVDCCHLPSIFQTCKCCPSKCDTSSVVLTQENCCNWPKSLQRCDCCSHACQQSSFDFDPVEDCCKLPIKLQDCSCCPTSPACLSDISYRIPEDSVKLWLSRGSTKRLLKYNNWMNRYSGISPFYKQLEPKIYVFRVVPKRRDAALMDLAESRSYAADGDGASSTSVPAVDPKPSSTSNTFDVDATLSEHPHKVQKRTTTKEEEILERISAPDWFFPYLSSESPIGNLGKVLIQDEIVSNPRRFNRAKLDGTPTFFALTKTKYGRNARTLAQPSLIKYLRASEICNRYRKLLSSLISRDRTRKYLAIQNMHDWLRRRFIPLSYGHVLLPFQSDKPADNIGNKISFYDHYLNFEANKYSTLHLAAPLPVKVAYNAHSWDGVNDILTRIARECDDTVEDRIFFSTPLQTDYQDREDYFLTRPTGWDWNQMFASTEDSKESEESKEKQESSLLKNSRKDGDYFYVEYPQLLLPIFSDGYFRKAYFPFNSFTRSYGSPKFRHLWNELLFADDAVEDDLRLAIPRVLYQMDSEPDDDNSGSELNLYTAPPRRHENFESLDSLAKIATGFEANHGEVEFGFDEEQERLLNNYASQPLYVRRISSIPDSDNSALARDMFMVGNKGAVEMIPWLNTYGVENTKFVISDKAEETSPHSSKFVAAPGKYFHYKSNLNDRDAFILPYAELNRNSMQLSGDDINDKTSSSNEPSISLPTATSDNTNFLNRLSELTGMSPSHYATDVGYVSLNPLWYTPFEMHPDNHYTEDTDASQEDNDLDSSEENLFDTTDTVELEDSDATDGYDEDENRSLGKLFDRYVLPLARTQVEHLIPQSERSSRALQTSNLDNELMIVPEMAVKVITMNNYTGNMRKFLDKLDAPLEEMLATLHELAKQYVLKNPVRVETQSSLEGLPLTEELNHEAVDNEVLAKPSFLGQYNEQGKPKIRSETSSDYWPIAYGTEDSKMIEIDVTTTSGYAAHPDKVTTETNFPSSDREESATSLAPHENDDHSSESSEMEKLSVVLMSSEFVPSQLYGFGPYLRPPMEFALPYCLFDQMSSFCKELIGGKNRPENVQLGGYSENLLDLNDFIINQAILNGLLFRMEEENQKIDLDEAIFLSNPLQRVIRNLVDNAEVEEIEIDNETPPLSTDSIAVKGLANVDAEVESRMEPFKSEEETSTESVFTLTTNKM